MLSWRLSPAITVALVRSRVIFATGRMGSTKTEKVALTPGSALETAWITILLLLPLGVVSLPAALIAEAAIAPSEFCRSMLQVTA